MDVYISLTVRIMSNYTVYHLHSDYSILDSTTKANDYILKAKELGMKAIGFSEHGNIYNWIKKKQACDEVGIKYMHGAEFYLTETLDEKIRDNYHTILYAKNYKGVLEINSLISISNKSDHFYYKPRISFDEFLNTSENIISTSACLASPLNKLEYNNQYYKKLINKYDFLEIQPHSNSEEQKSYNIYLYQLSLKYNKKLILGTDTHEINEYKQRCRGVLKKAKKSTYGNEDDFNLTFRDYESLINECKRQGCFDSYIYNDAIKNTNLLANMIEDFELDKSFKYPKLYDNEEKEYLDMIKLKFNHKIDNKIINPEEIDTYKERLKEEFDAFKKQGMFSYMLFMSELNTWCWDNNIPSGYGRGSVTGSVSAYILDITDVDSIIWHTIFSRFVNADRVSLADIDVDYAPEDRYKVYDYIRSRFGDNKTSYIVTFNSISEKGTIGEITRALEYDFKTSMDIKREFEEDEYKCRHKYPEVFEYYDGLLGTYISVGMHACGFIVSLDTLNDNIGFYYNDKDPVSQCDMKSIDSLNYVKLDILGLKNIGIIKETCKLIGKDYMKSHQINWLDDKVWKDMIKSPAGIFQFESEYSSSLLKRFKPEKINDMSIINASLRPSGSSYRENLLSRKFNNNPTKEINELLKDNYGYLIFQEDSIKFLQQICGMSGSESDTVRRAIGKKDIVLLNKMLPIVKNGYIESSKHDNLIAEKEVEAFIQVLSDSSDYQFGFNHSTAYSMIGYTCAYLRYYYPIEFTTAFLNKAVNENDLSMGNDLCELKNIKINPITFGKSSHEHDIKNGEIYKGMNSVKFINSKIPEELNNIYNNGIYDFPRVVELIKNNTSTNSRQLEVLIKIGYFREFGSIKKCLTFMEYYGKLAKKTYRKEIISKDLEFFIKGDSDETPKLYRNLNKELIFNNIWEALNDDEFDMIEIFKFELEYLGYISSPIPNEIMIVSISMVSIKNRSVRAIKISNGAGKWLKIKAGTSLPKNDSVIKINKLTKSNGYGGRTNYYIESYEKLI